MECDVLPLVPVIVMVRVPVVARRFTVIVMVDDPAPVIEAGLNPIVTRLPCPDADSPMEEWNPPVTAVLTVTLPELFRRTVIVLGLVLMEKPAVVLVTVRLTVVVCVWPPPVPVTVRVYVPGAVVAPTEMFIVDEPLPVIDDGLNPTVTPAGWPDDDSATAELNPPLTALVMVELPAFPCSTVTVEGDADKANPAVCVPPASVVIRAGLGLPQPVTRSYPVTAEKLPDVPLVTSWKFVA